MPVAAFDTETYYDKEYSVAGSIPTTYVNDPRFECYLISISREDGFKWTGEPKDCPWEELRGCDFLSHNAGFDRAVLRRMIQLGQAPSWVWPWKWHCTANLCVYVGLPRSLAPAVAEAFKIVLDKSIRDRDIKGIHWAQFPDELKQRVIKYAQRDADECLHLWVEFSDKWPELERRLSALTYEMGEDGLYLDTEGLDRDIALLQRAMFEARLKIPWADTDKILSANALALQCREVGIPPPGSLAKDSDECAEWEDQYGEKYPWVAAMRVWRRCNAICEKLQTARIRLKNDGRMPYSLLYFGAAGTGRWSGSGGWNAHNLPKKPYYFTDDYGLTEAKTGTSVDVRAKIVAPPGKKLIVADFAQIEARITPWLAGDRATLALAAKGMSVYEIHARTSMGWEKGKLKSEDPALYALAKARVLGLGFGCGWRKFASMIKKQVASGLLDRSVLTFFYRAPTPEKHSAFLQHIREKKWEAEARRIWPTLSPDDQNAWINSWLQVNDFREKNPKIVALWERLDEAARRSIGSMYKTVLPSGRELRYYRVHLDEENKLRAQVFRGGPLLYIYGGHLTENAVQATARDVLGQAIINLTDAGYKIVLHVHDEVVIEVDENDSTAVDRVASIMRHNPPWAKTLPLDVEAIETKVYLK